jgi:hypothetical protein
MIELKNSKTTYQGKAYGGEKYSLDAFIGAVQMLDPVAGWQDIRPQLVRDAGGWHIEGTPYYAEVKDDGTRLFCPDKNEKSRYIKILPHMLYKDLSKTVKARPDKLSGLSINSSIVMPVDFGEVEFLFSNTGMYLPITITSKTTFDNKFKDLLEFDIDTNLDINELLKSRAGLGIPKARIIQDSLDVLSREEILEWSYKDGKLSFGFDLTGKAEALRILDAIDVQVGAGADDGDVAVNRGEFDNTSDWMAIGWYGPAAYSLFTRFTGISGLDGVTVDLMNFLVYKHDESDFDGTIIYAEDAAAPAQITTSADYAARSITTAHLDVSENAGTGWKTYTITSVGQELADSYDPSVIQVLWKLGSYAGNLRGMRTYEYGDHSLAAKLHIEYTAGGATAKTAAEAGSGADGSALLATMTRAESGDGADAGLSLQSSLAKADSGSGIEQSLLSLLIKSLDTGAGAEAAVILLAGLMKGDSGTGAGGVSGRGLNLPDYGHGVDMLSALMVAVVAVETGGGIEQSTLASIVARMSAETGSGADAAAIIAGIITSETGQGIDAGIIIGLKQLFSADGGISIDALKALIAASGSGSDMKLPGRPGRAGIPSKGVSL